MAIPAGTQCCKVCCKARRQCKNLNYRVLYEGMRIHVGYKSYLVCMALLVPA